MKNKKTIYFIIFSFIFVFFFFLTIFLLSNSHWFYPYETVVEYDDQTEKRIEELQDDCEKLLVKEND